MPFYTDRGEYATLRFGFFLPETGGQVFPYDIIDPFVFLDMTGGVMPIVLLTSDTDLVAEYNYRTLDERAITDFFNH